ncbi:hypothetical protein RBA13_23070, partial [Mycobacteroides abscessus subsp. massiliense]
AKVAAKVEDVQDKASSAWAELGASWDAHVTKVKTAFSEKQHKVDAKLAAREADLAEADASYAVNIALSAIEEAEDAVLYAIYARRYADDLV